MALCPWIFEVREGHTKDVFEADPLLAAPSVVRDKSRSTRASTEQLAHPPLKARASLGKTTVLLQQKSADNLVHSYRRYVALIG